MYCSVPQPFQLCGPVGGGERGTGYVRVMTARVPFAQMEPPVHIRCSCK